MVNPLIEKIIRNSKRFLFLAGPVLLWIGVMSTGLLGPDFESAGSLIFAALLFLAGLPLSCLVRVDTLRDSFGIENHSFLLLLELLVAYLNLAALTAVLGWARGHLKRQTRLEPKAAKPEDQSGKVNGSGSFGRWRLN